ncbi:MAG: hypothetical protein CL811_08290 [Colwelliaceae bacterium]|nr:hypothetical protein [Colwelliaceae bacterium]
MSIKPILVILLSATLLTGCSDYQDKVASMSLEEFSVEVCDALLSHDYERVELLVDAESYNAMKKMFADMEKKEPKKFKEEMESLREKIPSMCTNPKFGEKKENGTFRVKLGGSNGMGFKLKEIQPGTYKALLSIPSEYR